MTMRSLVAMAVRAGTVSCTGFWIPAAITSAERTALTRPSARWLSATLSRWARALHGTALSRGERVAEGRVRGPNNIGSHPMHVFIEDAEIHEYVQCRGACPFGGRFVDDTFLHPDHFRMLAN